MRSLHLHLMPMSSFTSLSPKRNVISPAGMFPVVNNDVTIWEFGINEPESVFTSLGEATMMLGLPDSMEDKTFAGHRILKRLIIFMG